MWVMCRPRLAIVGKGREGGNWEGGMGKEKKQLCGVMCRPKLAIAGEGKGRGKGIGKGEKQSCGLCAALY